MEESLRGGGCPPGTWTTRGCPRNVDPRTLKLLAAFLGFLGLAKRNKPGVVHVFFDFCDFAAGVLPEQSENGFVLDLRRKSILAGEWIMSMSFQKQNDCGRKSYRLWDFVHENRALRDFLGLDLLVDAVPTQQLRVLNGLEGIFGETIPRFHGL